MALDATGVTCYAAVQNSTNCIINIHHGTFGATTNLLTNDLTGTTAGTDNTTSFTGAIAAGEWLSLHILAVNGTPVQLAVTLDVS